MTVRVDRREAALERMADHLLAEGLSGASLRALATAAGTSDRMLLYYFADKEELITATLGQIASRMPPLLAAAGLGEGPRPYESLLADVGPMFRRPDMRPFMALWLELAAQAGRGRQPYLAVAGVIADGFLEWIRARLETPPGADDRALAARLLATVEGAVLLEAVGRAAAAECALGRST